MNAERREGFNEKQSYVVFVLSRVVVVVFFHREKKVLLFDYFVIRCRLFNQSWTKRDGSFYSLWRIHLNQLQSF